MKRITLSAVAFTLFFAPLNCSAEAKVEAIGFAERVIYRAPDTPGYSAWVGLWQLPDGRLRCDFNQITGPTTSPVSTVPVLESQDGGGTWNRIATNNPTVALGPGPYYQYGRGSCRGMAVLPDGTLVRPVCLPDAEMTDKTSGYVERSTDDGKTWGEKIYVLPVKDYHVYAMLIKRLRDGRLVLFAGCWKRHDPIHGGAINNTKTMFISSDEGKTWSKPIVIMPPETGVCEESDFCELPNGDLFWVHRAGHYPDHMTDIPSGAVRMGPNPPESYWYNDRMQSIVRKQGETFVPGKCEPAHLPHSGFPAVMYTQEGIILHLATDGVSWTTDLGKTWTRLNIPGTPYYPQALQLKDGTIILVGHRGGDDKYGTVDQCITQQTFRLKVSKEK